MCTVIHMKTYINFTQYAVHVHTCTCTTHIYTCTMSCIYLHHVLSADDHVLAALGGVVASPVIDTEQVVVAVKHTHKQHRVVLLHVELTL